MQRVCPSLFDNQRISIFPQIAVENCKTILHNILSIFNKRRDLAPKYLHLKTIQ